MAATKALFLLGLLALFAVATARSDDESVADAVSGVVPSGSRALLNGKYGFGHFDFHSYGHQKYIVYKKEKYEDEDEDDHDDDDCDDEDNDDCGEKKYYKHCYYKKSHKRCDCKKEHKRLYYIVKYKKSKCH